MSVPVSHADDDAARLPPSRLLKLFGTIPLWSHRASMRQSGAGKPASMARSRRGSLTPRIGSLGEAMQERSKKATSRAALSYNARSWSLTLKMLDIRHEQAFVLCPWLLFTAWAAALVTSRHLSDDVRMWLADGVPASATGGLATTMSMLLAFRPAGLVQPLVGRAQPVGSGGAGDAQLALAIDRDRRRPKTAAILPCSTCPGGRLVSK